jgi:hypothetical protein
MKVKLHCDKYCHKAGRVYHHKGFKTLVVLSLMVLVIAFKGEPITLTSFFARSIDLVADLVAAKTLKV